MFTFLGGIGYWPLTATVALLRAAPDRVARSCQPFKGGRGSSFTTTRYARLDEALRGTGPLPFAVQRAQFAVGAGAGEWTAVLNSGFPVGDVVAFFQARAGLNLRCEYVGVAWEPRTSEVSANAQFVHYRPTRRLFGREPAPGDMRWLQASDNDDGWVFDAHGPVRDFEELDRYTAGTAAQRLGYHLIGRYLAALGLPVDDPGWLTGPVFAAVRPPLRAAEHSWSTVAELRKLCGYPDDRIPSELVRWS